MSTIFIVDVLARSGKDAVPSKEKEIIHADDIGTEDAEEASKRIRKLLTDRHFSVTAWRVHKVTSEQKRVVQNRPTRVAKLIETTTEEIVRNFSPNEAKRWYNHDYRQY